MNRRYWVLMKKNCIIAFRGQLKGARRLSLISDALRDITLQDWRADCRTRTFTLSTLIPKREPHVFRPHDKMGLVNV